MEGRRYASDMRTIQLLSSSSQNRETFSIEENFLLCKACEKKIDHSRQDTLEKHLASTTHIENKKKLHTANSK